VYTPRDPANRSLLLGTLVENDLSTTLRIPIELGQRMSPLVCKGAGRVPAATKSPVSVHTEYVRSIQITARLIYVVGCSRDIIQMNILRTYAGLCSRHELEYCALCGILPSLRSIKGRRECPLARHHYHLAFSTTDAELEEPEVPTQQARSDHAGDGQEQPTMTTE
jgi:hypothetical protein